MIEHRRARQLRIGEHCSWSFEDRRHGAVPGAGDAAHRAHLRARGDRRGAGGLQSADSGRQQSQGHAADRIRRSGPSAPGVWSSCAASSATAGCGWRGFEAVYAIADEDLERENDSKTSAVHFLRFEFTAPMIARRSKPARHWRPASIILPIVTASIRCRQRCGASACWRTSIDRLLQRPTAFEFARMHRPSVRLDESAPHGVCSLVGMSATQWQSHIPHPISKS